MAKLLTIAGTMLMVWSTQAHAFQCETVSGSFSNKVRTPIQMTEDKASSSAQGEATADGGVQIKVLVKAIKKPGLWTEGSATVNGVSLTLGIVNPSSALGSDTIASVSAEGGKNGLNLSDLKISALGRVSEKSWIRVECRGD